MSNAKTPAEAFPPGEYLRDELVERGGTWSGATEALKHGYGSVAVWRGDGEGPGNGPLQQQGDVPVSRLDDIELLLDSEQDPPSTSSWGTVEQQSLFATLPPS